MPFAPLRRGSESNLCGNFPRLSLMSLSVPRAPHTTKGPVEEHTYPSQSSTAVPIPAVLTAPALSTVLTAPALPAGPADPAVPVHVPARAPSPILSNSLFAMRLATGVRRLNSAGAPCGPGRVMSVPLLSPMTLPIPYQLRPASGSQTPAEAPTLAGPPPREAPPVPLQAAPLTARIAPFLKPAQPWAPARFPSRVVVPRGDAGIAPTDANTPGPKERRMSGAKKRRYSEVRFEGPVDEKIASCPSSEVKLEIPQVEAEIVSETELDDSCPSCGDTVQKLIPLLCGHGKACSDCWREWASTWITKGKAIRCIAQPRKCAHRTSARFLEMHAIVDDDLLCKYREIEGDDAIAPLVAQGTAYRCSCGKVYERDGGFCSTGVCDSCNTGFCFKCQRTLRVVGMLRHAEPHMCPLDAPRMQT